MNLCDSNVWLALALDGHQFHRDAVTWLGGVEEHGSIAFCRATQQSLLRLLTSAAVLVRYGERPLTNEQAWSAYEAFLDDDRIVVHTAEPPGLERQWRRLAARETASPKLWMDAYLAAFALAGGDRIVTTDGDFRQFESLDVLLLG